MYGTDQDNCSSLIRQHKIAFVEYPQDIDTKEAGQPLPQGLERHEVYIIRQATKQVMPDAVTENDLLDQMAMEIQQ